MQHITEAEKQAHWVQIVKVNGVGAANQFLDAYEKRFPKEGQILPPKFTASCGLTPETVIAGRTYKHINFPGVVYLGTEVGVLVIIEPGNYANRGCVVAYSGTGDSFWDGFSGCEE